MPTSVTITERSPGADSPLAELPGRGRLAGAVAIVAGSGSSGEGMSNGRATAVVLARESAHVVVVDKDPASAARTVELIGRAGGSAASVQADVTQEADCARAVAAAAQRTGRVDILVNCVGVTGERSTVVGTDVAAWELGMRVNVLSAALMSKHAIALIPRGGAIVNLTSLAGRRATDRVVYCATKSALSGLTVAMAGQHGPDGIRVNAVCPGSVWTPLAAAAYADADQSEIRTSRVASNPLRSEGTGWDTGYAVLFLVSPESRWITGQTLTVDGGLSAVLPR